MRIQNILIFLFLLVLVFGHLFLLGAGPALAELKEGHVLGPKNWQEAEGYVPSPIQNLIKQGYTIKVIKEPIIISPDFINAGNKYADQVKILPDGSLEGYKGGFPFPKIDLDDPQAGVKIAWNMYRRWWGDDKVYCRGQNGEYSGRKNPQAPDFAMARRWCVDRSGHLLLSDLGSWEVRPTCRVTLPDVKGYEDFEYIRMTRVTSPRDVAGTASIEKRFWDPKKEDDFYLYIPSIRRVRRLPTNARSSTRAPADYSWDDVGGFSGKLQRFKWKLIDKRKMLAFRMFTVPAAHNIKKFKAMPVSETWSLHDGVIIEMIPKDPKYTIRRKTYWVDLDSWMIIFWEAFDRKGELWRSFGMHNARYWSRDGKKFVDSGDGCWALDVQSDHSSDMDCQISYNVGFEADSFSVRNITSVSRGGMRFR